MIQSEYEARQSVEDRKAAATLRMKEKVAVLQSWLLDGVPEGYEWSPKPNPDGKQPDKKYGCPANLVQFREWYDPELKVEVQLEGRKHTVEGVFPVSAATVDKDYNADIKAQVVKLIPELKNLKTPKKVLAKLKTEKKMFMEVNQNLVNENAKLRHEILTLEEDLEELMNQNVALRDRVRELDKKLVNLVPGPRPVE